MTELTHEDLQELQVCTDFGIEHPYKGANYTPLERELFAIIKVGEEFGELYEQTQLFIQNNQKNGYNLGDELCDVLSTLARLIRFKYKSTKNESYSIVNLFQREKVNIDMQKISDLINNMYINITNLNKQATGTIIRKNSKEQLENKNLSDENTQQLISTLVQQCYKLATLCNIDISESLKANISKQKGRMKKFNQ